MSLDHLPENIEQGVQSYAAALHISHDEALLRIIENGLFVSLPPAAVPGQEEASKPGERLIGMMSSPEDAVLMDEIVNEAMQARRHRWERLSRA